MSFYSPPWDSNVEPNETNVRSWAENLYMRGQPVEQLRWIESDTDVRYHAGDQRYINRAYNFNPGNNWQNFHFNIIQQPINMVTGYQRQHRKSINYIPTEGADTQTTDQYTKLITHANNSRGILEKYSRGCEESAIQGMVLLQPYLDYRDDPVNGSLESKVWSYNSFMMDPYWREPDMSDCNFVWCQQFIAKREAQSLFPDQQINGMQPMSGSSSRPSRFYFLPENYNMIRTDLLVMSYIWYKWRRKRKKLINRVTQEVFDFTGSDEEIKALLPFIGEDVLEEIEVEVPTWKMCTLLNDQLMWQGYNPLGFDECPFVPLYWNYDPQIVNPSLRVRSLTRTMRDAQFLFNRRVILNHDISESSINSGFKFMEDSIANPENLNATGQGRHLIVKAGFDLTAIEKIIPNAVPASDMQLADQLLDLMFRVSGINQELMGMSEDKGTAGITEMLRQGAGLVTLQKYFDQWDYALKLFGEREISIIQNNWSAAKVGRMIGEQPTPQFFSKMFSKYHVLVAEGLDTTIQKQQQFAQALQLNQMMGGTLPPSWIIQQATIQGKKELMEAMDQQAQEQKAVQDQAVALEQAGAQANLQLLHARSAAEMAQARERHGRAESNIGLFEERLSEISQNRSMAVKNKVESLEKLLNVIKQYGEIETALKESELQSVAYDQELSEDREKADAKQTSLANDFFTNIMGGQQQIGA